MEEGDGIQNIREAAEMRGLYLENQPPPRDLLRRFRGGPSGEEGARPEGVDEDGPELSLGLSLGGRFGLDRQPVSLARSSSVAAFLLVPPRDDDNNNNNNYNNNEGGERGPQGRRYAGLVRAASMPVVSEEEWRKRKEMQTLRRQQAKRRRSEKQRREREGGGGGPAPMEVDQSPRGNLRRQQSLNRPIGMTVWAAIGPDVGETSTVFGGDSQQGSIGEPSPIQTQPLHESCNNQDRAGPSAPRPLNSETAISRLRARGGREINQPAGIDEMPCVFTKGNGLNGRVIDGILYKYGKGIEQLKIMCVCHGALHSPAEFVIHAGGSEVENPLKHIVVNPNAAQLV